MDRVDTESYFTYKGVECVLKTGPFWNWRDADGKRLEEPKYEGWFTGFYTAYRYRCDPMSDEPLKLIGESETFQRINPDFDEAMKTHVATLQAIKSGELEFNLDDPTLDHIRYKAQELELDDEPESELDT